MSENDTSNTTDNDTSASHEMKGEFDAGHKGVKSKALFTEDEIDIYVNKATLNCYFFHGIEVDYGNLKQLEYDPIDNSVIVRRNDNTAQDLGVKIQWLIRPYFTKADVIYFVQTKDGESVDGTSVPLVHKVKD